MSDFSEQLKQLRREKGLSQKELAEIAGVSKSSINMYERGDREPSLQTLLNLAEYFGVNVAYLLGASHQRHQDNEWPEWTQGHSLNKTSGLIHVKRLPILGEISCGKPIFAEEEQGSFAEIGTDLNADFCLRARGDSMIGARIMDGDLVFIRSQSTVENGEIAAVIIEDTATLKRFYYYPEESKLSLNAENPRYAPLIYVGDELEHIRILGKAVAFQSKL